MEQDAARSVPTQPWPRLGALAVTLLASPSGLAAYRRPLIGVSEPIERGEQPQVDLCVVFTRHARTISNRPVPRSHISRAVPLRIPEHCMKYSASGRHALLAVALLLPLNAALARSNSPAGASHVVATVDLTGTVTDSTNGQPLQSAEISVARPTGGVVSNAVTDAFGRFTIHNLAPGSYSVERAPARISADHPAGDNPVNRRARRRCTFAMTPIGTEPRRRCRSSPPFRSPSTRGRAIRSSSRTIFTARRPTRRRRFCSSRSPAPCARRPARSTFAASTPSTRTTSTACRCRRAFPAL